MFECFQLVFYYFIFFLLLSPHCLSLHLCLLEGVQLLCLIDKAADACRYLQTYGEWNRAAWLAKVLYFEQTQSRASDKSILCDIFTIALLAI